MFGESGGAGNPANQTPLFLSVVSVISVVSRSA